MLYLEYEMLKKEYRDTQERFRHILDKKEVIFQKTQPKSTQYDQERIMGGEKVNKNDSYMIELEKLGKELEVAEFIIGKRLRLLKLKEMELRESKEIEDVIYCLRFIDRRKVTVIARKINYSKSSVHRILKKIKKNLKVETK